MGHHLPYVSKGVPMESKSGGWDVQFRRCWKLATHDLGLLFTPGPPDYTLSILSLRGILESFSGPAQFYPAFPWAAPA